MKGMIGLLATALIGGAIYWMVLTKTQGAGGTSGAPAQAISTVGVENDLLSIAQAERAYQAEHGSYVSLDELNSSGALTLQKTGRAGYTYSVETNTDGFTATAKCGASTAVPCTNFAVDQTMQVHQVQ
jgi:hypothetical protein